MLDGNFRICGEAENGQQAIELAQTLKPDLVLMDVSMPVVGGLEATREIKLLLPRIKILILSMHDGAQIRLSATNAGADEVISKTAKVSEVIAAIENLLRA